jgi:hypothetical protein
MGEGDWWMALATEREDISLDVVAVEVGCERLFRLPISMLCCAFAFWSWGSGLVSSQN